MFQTLNKIIRDLDDGESMADRLPWGHEERDVFMNVDGSIGMVWEWIMPSTELMETEALDALSRGLAAFLVRLPAGADCQFILLPAGNISQPLLRYCRFESQGVENIKDVLSRYKVEDFNRRGRSSGQGHLRSRVWRVLLTVREGVDWKNREEISRRWSLVQDREGHRQETRRHWEQLRDLLLRRGAGWEEGWRQMNIGFRRYKGCDLGGWLYSTLNPKRAEDVPYVFNARQPLRDQVLFHEPLVGPEGVELDGAAWRLVTLKECPAETSPGMWSTAAGLAGNLLGQPGFLGVTVNFTVPDQSTALEQLKFQKAFAFMQRGSSSGDISEEAAGQKDELSAVIARIYREGHVLVQARIHFLCGGSTVREADDMAEAVIQELGRRGAQGVRESLIGGSLIMTCLPLNFRAEFEPVVRRARRMLSCNLADMLPVYGNYRGGESPAQMYLNRSGEPVFLDPFEGGGNPHCAVIGSSGSGKSFFTNDLILQNYRNGAHFFVLDKGNSYRKLCRLLGGKYLSFDMANPVCINPFNRPANAESLAFLGDMLAVMAAGDDERDRVSREERGLLQLAVIEAQQDAAESREVMTLGRVVGILADPPPEMVRGTDPRIATRLALRLTPFTARGAYGQFFDGRQGFEAEGRFTVFELAHLSRYPDLQLAVLLNIMYQVTRVTSDEALRGVRKFLVIDEAWQLLRSPGTAEFISGAFKTFRKYGCCVMAITQEAADLLSHPSGLAILANSDNKYFLRQDPSVVARMSRDLALSAPVERLMRTLVTLRGQYAEILALNPSGGGVVRLAPDSFLYWAATSDAAENEYLEKVCGCENDDLMRAVQLCARERPHGLR